MKKYTFIYCLLDPVSNKPRYVGKANDPKTRLKNHLNPARYKNTHKFNWIKSLRKNNLKPKLLILERVGINDWRVREKYWIRYFVKRNYELVNYTVGGDGLSFGNQTSFKKGDNAIPVLQFTKVGVFVKEWSVMSDASKKYGKCIYHVCSGIKKTCGGYIWIRKSDYSKSNLENRIVSLQFKRPVNTGCFKKGMKPVNAKKVKMFSIEGDYIRTFNSAKQAGEFVNVTGGAIQYACTRSKTNICKNFKFKYEE